MAHQNSSQSRTPEYCPVCGEDVPRGARACPECGADHRSGWRDDATGEESAGEFEYDAFVRNEFGKTPLKPPHLSIFWWIIAIVVTAAMIVLLIHGLF